MRRIDRHDCLDRRFPTCRRCRLIEGERRETSTTVLQTTAALRRRALAGGSGSASERGVGQAPERDRRKHVVAVDQRRRWRERRRERRDASYAASTAVAVSAANSF